MKALAALILASMLTACSVNVVVAPYATLAVDSLNQKADTNTVQPLQFEVQE